MLNYDKGMPIVPLITICDKAQRNQCFPKLGISVLGNQMASALSLHYSSASFYSSLHLEADSLPKSVAMFSSCESSSTQGFFSYLLLFIVLPVGCDALFIPIFKGSDQTLVHSMSACLISVCSPQGVTK